MNQIFAESENFIKSPANWQSKDFLTLGLVLAGTYGLMNADEEIRDFSQNQRNEILDIPMYFGTLYGEPFTPLLIGGGLIISSNSGNEKNKRIGFEVLQANLYSVVITQITKMVLGRTRPYKNEGAFNFTFLNFTKNDFWSMPSGHTDVAFATSTALALNTDNNVLKIIFFAPAVLTGISRIYHDRHWASDVFLGAAIGYFTARFVHNLHDQKNNDFMINQPTATILNFNFAF